MRTAIIIDPVVTDYAGHHFTAAAGWAEAAETSGLNIRILAHRGCVAEAIGGVAIEKVFSGSYYHVAPADQPEALTRLRVMQGDFRDALAKPLMRVGSGDVAVLAHSTLVTLNGVAAWAAGMPRQRLPRLVAWFVLGPHQEDFLVPFGSTDCLVAAIDRIRDLFGDRLTLVGSTRDVSRRWEDLVGGVVHFLPFTALRPALQARTDHTASSPLSIVWTGHLGSRKGLNLMPALIKELDRRGIPIQWTIGGTSYEVASPAFAEIAGLAKSRTNVSFTTSPEGLTDYDDFLKSADLVLLPYSPEFYDGRGSGVAEEAELLGLPYVAPKVAFSAEAVSAGAAVSFEEWTVEGIAEAVIEAVNTFPQLSRCAGNHALRTREQLKEVRRRFLSLIFADGEDGAPVIATPVAPLPGVDVIVTVHNYRRYLHECLASVSRQTYPNWRCIVVDDGSTDLTFDELRTAVKSFGDRFSYERHGIGSGQIKAAATGLSLGSNPFVLMLDADDCLTDDALDRHLSWHLNGRVPVAFTSGRVQVVDELGRLLAGCLDNVVWMDIAGATTELPCGDAYRRSEVQFEPPPASLLRQQDSGFGRWFWSPTSALMFRRTVMEILLPDDIDLGAYGADTYFGYASQAVGGSILIDTEVALYRRHGANGYSDMGVYGAGTIAERSASPYAAEVARSLRAHVLNNRSRFHHQIGSDHVERLLVQTAQIENTEPRRRSQAFEPSAERAIRRFSSWMTRRRILFGLTRRLLAGRKAEARLLIERSLRAEGLPHLAVAPVTEELGALPVVLGLAVRRLFARIDTVQEHLAATIHHRLAGMGDAPSVDAGRAVPGSTTVRPS